jgi:NADH-quinone oxidoreductase subunit J
MTEAYLFWPLAILTCVAAAGVIVARNPVYSAMSLVTCFFFLAGIYVLLCAHFVAVIQIMVYAGAIMVLFLFVIMLLALTDKELAGSPLNMFKLVGKAIGVAAAATIGLLLLGQTNRQFQGPPGAASVDFGTVAQVGNLLMHGYVVQFEVVSLLLLVAIVGAVVVAKGKI